MKHQICVISKSMPQIHFEKMILFLMSLIFILRKCVEKISSLDRERAWSLISACIVENCLWNMSVHMHVY